jgi:hypothetical protein
MSELEKATLETKIAVENQAVLESWRVMSEKSSENFHVESTKIESTTRALQSDVGKLVDGNSSERLRLCQRAWDSLCGPGLPAASSIDAVE